MKGDGNYWCACVRCDAAYYGAKYSVLCPDCKALAAGARSDETNEDLAQSEGRQSGPKGNAQEMGHD